MQFIEPVEPEGGIYQRPYHDVDYKPPEGIQDAIEKVYTVFQGAQATQLAEQDIGIALSLTDEKIDINMAAALCFMAGNNVTDKLG